MNATVEDATAYTSRPSWFTAILALAGAAFPVSAIITLTMGDVRLYPFVAVVTLMIVLGVGGGTFAMIRERPACRRVLIGGFVTGAVVPALLILVSTPDSAAVGGVATVVDGSYTWAGWKQNITVIGGFGIIGIVGALMVWGLVLLLDRSPWLVRSALIGLIAIGTSAMWVIPDLTADRSCHNPLRDGRTSISPVAGTTLAVPMSDWRALQAELGRFARDEGWQLLTDVRPDPAFPWFQVSLCRETGTQLFVSLDCPDESRVRIDVYQPQGGESWREPLLSLQHALDDRWEVTGSQDAASEA